MYTGCDGDNPHGIHKPKRIGIHDWPITDDRLKNRKLHRLSSTPAMYIAEGIFRICFPLNYSINFGL